MSWPHRRANDRTTERKRKLVCEWMSERAPKLTSEGQMDGMGRWVGGIPLGLVCVVSSDATEVKQEHNPKRTAFAMHWLHAECHHTVGRCVGGRAWQKGQARNGVSE
jgi:hypothetical protein